MSYEAWPTKRTLKQEKRFTPECLDTLGGNARKNQKPTYPVWFGVCHTCQGVDYGIVQWDYQTQKQDYQGTGLPNSPPDEVSPGQSKANMPLCGGHRIIQDNRRGQHDGTMEPN